MDFTIKDFNVRFYDNLMKMLFSKETKKENRAPDCANKDYLEYCPSGVVLIMDVRDFESHEIACTVSNFLLEVRAESKRIGRCKIHRKYVMPRKIDPQQCMCQISREGMLCIIIPWQL